MQKDVGSRRNAPAFHAALRSPTKQPAVPEPPGHENANHHAPRGPEDALGAVEVASGLFFQSLALLLVLPQAPPPLPPGRPAVPSRRPPPDHAAEVLPQGALEHGGDVGQGVATTGRARRTTLRKTMTLFCRASSS